MKQGYTDITVLIDRSGSMIGSESDVIGGFNTLIEKQKEVDGQCTVSLIQFDTKYEVNYIAKDVNDVPALEYYPRGGTALVDALGRTINETGRRLQKLPESDRPEQVIFVVQTDGEENSSREFNSEQVREMVEHQQGKYDWDFMFFGADIDAFDVAGGLGFSRANTIQFAKGGKTTNAVFAATAENMANYRSTGVKASLNYSSSQRQEAVDTPVDSSTETI